MDDFTRRLAVELDRAREEQRALRVSLMLESGTTVGGTVTEVSTTAVAVTSDRDGATALVRPEAIVSFIIR